MGWFDWLPTNPFDWSSISLNIYIGVIGFVLLLVGGILLTRGTKGTVLVGILLFVGGGASLAWALGLI